MRNGPLSRFELHDGPRSRLIDLGAGDDRRGSRAATSPLTGDNLLPDLGRGHGRRISVSADGDAGDKRPAHMIGRRVRHSLRPGERAPAESDTSPRTSAAVSGLHRVTEFDEQEATLFVVETRRTSSGFVGHTCHAGGAAELRRATDSRRSVSITDTTSVKHNIARARSLL